MSMARKAGMKTVFSTHSHYDPRAVRTPVPGVGVRVQHADLKFVVLILNSLLFVLCTL